MRAREEISGWLWASPWILGFLLFTLGPMIASLYLAFTRYSIANPPVWIGLDNFTRALCGEDRLFWPSMGRTLTWAFVMVPIGIGLSLAGGDAAQPGAAGAPSSSAPSSSCPP